MLGGCRFNSDAGGDLLGGASAQEVQAEEHVDKETTSLEGCVVQHQRGSYAVETHKAENKNTLETN